MYKILKQEKAICSDRKRISCFKRQEQVLELGGLPTKEHENIFWSDRKVLYLDSDCGYMGVCICQNPNCTGKMGVLYCI